MANPAREAAVAHAAEWHSMTARIKDTMVTRLDLPIPADWITDDQPLFGRGLELDSLDALELSMAVDQEFKTPMYEENTSMFGSISAFLDYMISKASDPAMQEIPDPTNGIALAMQQVRNLKPLQ